MTLKNISNYKYEEFNVGKNFSISLYKFKLASLYTGFSFISCSGDSEFKLHPLNVMVDKYNRAINLNNLIQNLPIFVIY